jgi:hypothetical protein
MQHQMITRTFALTTLALVVASFTALQAGDLRSAGLEVSSTPSRVAFTLQPVIERWDTVIGRSGMEVRPVIKRARIRQSADGSVVQWIIPFDVIVPHPTGFDLSVTDIRAHRQSLPLQAGFTPEGVIVPTPAPLTQAADIAYTGIGRGRHYATVSVVVAETRNGHTSVVDRVTGDIALAPSASGLRATHDGVGVEDRIAVNADAPWWAADTRPTLNKTAESVQSEAIASAWLIEITEEGVYRITADQLRAAGLPTDAAAAQTLKLYGRDGMELPETVEPPQNIDLHEHDIIVRTNSDGSIADVLFYASGPNGFQVTKTGSIEHYIHHYDTKAGYMLTHGGSPGKRSTIRPSASQPVEHRPLTTTGYVYQEEEIVAPYNQGSGRKWWGRAIANDGSLVMTTPLPALVRSGQIRYRTNLAHNGTTSGVVTVTENGTAIAQRSLSSVPKYMDTYSGSMAGSIDASKIAADGRSVLRFMYQSSDRAANGFLDWFEIAYPRGLVANDREFSFFTEAGITGVCEYTINGFEGGEIYAFDVTDRKRPQRVANAGPQGSLFSIREYLSGDSIRRYYITSKLKSTGLRSIGSLSLRDRALKGELGTMIIITGPQVRASATRYADYRAQESGLSVSVVTTEEIFNEFGYGIKDPTAIRDFIGHAYRRSPIKPRYVLLWGDGHFDYKNISSPATNIIIPYESLDPDDTSWGLSTYTTDDYYVRVEGNDARIDCAIGRLPITSNAIGDRMAAKIRAYEHLSARDDWRTRIGLVADDGETSNNETDGNLHLRQSESLTSTYVPMAFQPKKFYLVEYPTENVARGRRKPSVTADYISTLNTSGALLFNWIGHGNPRVWAHEFVFERETTPQQMHNANKPFFLTAATCDFARFDLADVQSGAEELVLLEEGGAIGSFSSTRVVFAWSNAEINEEFYSQLFSRETDGKRPRLGDVMFRVKQKLFGDNDEKFFLMADPAMRLLIPDHNVVFETINGQNIDSTLIQVKALSTVTVTGRITPPLGNDVDGSFNGTATVSLLDAQRRVTVTDTDPPKTVNTFTLPGAALSRGSYKVENGRFEATFVVPKDIAFSDANARLYGYAISDDDRTAMGATDKVRVNEVASESFDDTEGPDIKIYMDSRLFRNGEVVRPTPILIVDLSDKTGINTTGIGVGHGILANFNEGGLVEDITESFSTSLNDSRAGTATKQIFTLGPGHHTVRVRAWDVLNNMSEATTSFRIAEQDEGVVTSWVFNFPNPFSSATTIRFKHNVNAPFTADISIHDMQGRAVYVAPMSIKDMQTAEIIWDGETATGESLSSGIYAAVITVTEASGASSVVSGKLALIR